MDVRITKTKERLKDALFSMMENQSLETISISDLCKKASINRNTFYSHYSSVNDLLYEIEEDFLESIIEKLKLDSNVTKNAMELIASVLEVVKENKEITSLLFSANGDKDFLKTIVMFAFPSAVENWAKELYIPQEKGELLYFFVQGGIVSVVEQWVKSDFAIPTKELAENLNLMILRGQSAFQFTYSKK